jgi:nitrogen fixation protein NifM
MEILEYYRLKAAHALFSKGYAALGEGERTRVDTVAQRYANIESAVLARDKASGVSLSPDASDTALAEIRARYPDEDAFACELNAAGLQRDALAVALRRELLVAAVLERVGAEAGEVGKMETEIFYFSHLDRFRANEQRAARHILITVNDDFADNMRPIAERRINEIATRIATRPSRFEEQARKHSECPTALNGGLLGTVTRGKLFPELDAALFEMDAGEISAPLESQLGFHLLRCDAVHPARTLPYSEVASSLRKRLTEQRSNSHSKAWLAELLTRHHATQ